MTDAVLGPGSTVVRRQLGRSLRDARNQSRLGVDAAAKALEWGRTKIWKIESGQVAIRSHDVKTMCEVYGATAEFTAVLVDLAKQTKAEGWWQDHGPDAIPTNFDLYLGLEAAVSELRWYEAERVPGLFQTADYARAIIDSGRFDRDAVEHRVELRMARQTLLTRVTAAPTMIVVLNEAVLRRPVGGRQVMAQQLARLVEISELPNVTLHVMPFSFGMHEGLRTGSFGILRFPTNIGGQDTEPPVVYVEGVTGGLYLEKAHEIQRYDDAFAGMVSLIDDDVARSTGFLREAARELHG